MNWRDLVWIDLQNGLAIFGGTDEVPDAVKQTICDTLQNLPDAPERKN